MKIKQAARSIWLNPGNRGKRHRKIVAGMAWQAHKRLIRSPRIIRLANGVLFNAYPDCVVSSGLIYSDFPEYYELTFLRRQLRPGHITLDVGAYVGHISLLLSDIVGPDNLYAFEPNTLHFQRLNENWQLNLWSTKNLFHCAVGDRQTQVYVQDLEHPSPKHETQIAPQAGYSVQVPLVSLDTLRGSWQCPIGLLKIDVEGNEGEVFAGSKILLKHNRPRLIMFESLSGGLDTDIQKILATSDYIVFQLNAQGQPDFSNHTAQNLFAVACEYRHTLIPSSA